jgi:hypothetical protein
MRNKHSGSIEGIVYTTIPISGQAGGYLEIVPQALIISHRGLLLG